ncbi:MAG: M13 family metallopeptidase [Candidatus Eisenbacteria bacterium]
MHSHFQPFAFAALVLALAGPTRAAGLPDPSHRADLDTTCAPCHDFDQYANGGWKQRTMLPPGYTSYGAFDQVADRNVMVLRRLLESAAADRRANPDSDRAKLGRYYATAMDSSLAESRGVGPVQPLLHRIDAITSQRDLAREIGWLQGHGIGALFGFFAAQDPKNSEEVIAFASQGGLGLPDRDYYTRQDSASKATREVYRRTTARLLSLAGRADGVAGTEADQVLALETRLALASMTGMQRRDPQAVYHKMPFDSLRALAPTFAWDDFLAARAARPGSVNVTQPVFFARLQELVAQTPLPTWRAYLSARVLRDAAPLLSSPFVAEWFALRQALSGAKEMLPRWKRMINETDESLGEILGREYVRETFTPADKARMLAMVKNLEAALGMRIQAAEWMSDSTRRQAAGKLAAFSEKIGYPDTWKDYASVKVVRGEHYENLLAARAFEATRNITKIGKPVQRGEWSMTPPTVNAFYSSSLNSINFPAGILQPPFFDSQADDATNYGAIGAVIGHEMSHGFDDRGRQFDARGNLRDWWTAGDIERYKARAKQVSEQFSSYTVLDTLHVNGALTLGESIADLGGLAVAYAAMQKAYEGRPHGRIGGFTPEQRFFLGWAHVWHEIATDEELRTLVQTDPHPPARWRINGPMSNLKEFQDAWGCKPGDAMVRDEAVRARIW